MHQYSSITKFTMIPFNIKISSSSDRFKTPPLG
jgi:hypothetical protein